MSGGLGSNSRNVVRVLWVTKFVPHVPSTGALTRSFHLLRAATRVGHVTLIAAPDPGRGEALQHARDFTDLRELPAPPGVLPGPFARLKDLSHTVEFRYPRARPVGRLADQGRAARHAFGLGSAYDVAALKAAVRELLRKQRFDLIVADHTRTAVAIGPLTDGLRARRVASLHDVVSLSEARSLAARSRHPSWLERHMLARIAEEERGILRRYDTVLVPSSLDAAELARLVPDPPVHAVPNGVDAEYFARSSPAIQGAPTRRELVFTGDLAHPPNPAGLTWFITNVWPRLRSYEPAAQLQIVGAGPVPGALDGLVRETPGVRLHVSVPDVRPYLASASVAIVPLLSGSGTRLKILEALAAGLPVVSTTIGAEGLEVVDGADLLLADDPETFVTHIVSLMEHPDDAQRLVDHGRATVTRLYNWPGIESQFTTILAALLNENGRPPFPTTQFSER